MNHKETMSTLLVTIGRRILEKRKQKKLTQQELAFKCDKMDKATISSLETFRYENVTIGLLAKISAALECDITDLMK
jgi:transcriptional regulator with XRE-family HTH domain